MKSVEWALVLVVLLLGVLGGCSSSPDAADAGGGSGADADVARDGAPRSPQEQCGNGLDDDGDGRIDDGCPCGPGETQACFTGSPASRGVGSCHDGVQTCSVEPGGREWGDWGDSPCMGAVEPVSEQCDGADHDCDGAVDEGCPCSTGETRECGPSLASPCMRGTQSCRADGTWSGCEGAVWPSSDVCDEVDNDCDGTVDEGCGCVPQPEVCGDGIDNDCDGEEDEASCIPESPADEEVCGNGTDDDRNGFIDDGCETDCPCVADDIRWDRVAVPVERTHASEQPGLSAWTGSEHLFAYTLTDDDFYDRDSSSPYHVYVSRYDASGSHIETSRVTDDPVSSTQHVRRLLWTGRHALLLAYGDSVGSKLIYRVGSDGDRIGDPVDVGNTTDIAWNGHTVGRLYWEGSGEGRTLMFAQLEEDLTPRGSPVDLGAPRDATVARLAWTGARWVVVYNGPSDYAGGGPGGAIFLEATTITDEYELPAATMRLPHVAGGPEGALICGFEGSPLTYTSPVTCRVFGPEGSPRGDDITIDGGPFRHFGEGLVHWKCGYLVILRGLTDPGTIDTADASRIVRISPTGEVEDVPLPSLGSTEITDHTYGYNTFFPRYFGSLEHTPGELYFPTGWHRPKGQLGRMRVSCGGE